MSESKIRANPGTQELREKINERLAQLVLGECSGHVLTAAIRYALLAPGKRLRPLICLMSAQCLGGKMEDAVDPACALEMIHTASLLIDDLPCMDDAHMRRGQLACHRRFGEATAILVAFELLCRGFRVINEAPNLSDPTRIRLLKILTGAVGVDGLIGGQERDLAAEREQNADTDRVMRIHAKKTGALFIAAAESGGIVAGLEDDQLVPVREFAGRFGLAYQTLDDLLDAQANSDAAGKDVRNDADKATLVGVLGVDAATEYANNMIAAAMEALQPLGPNMRPLENFIQSTIDHAADIRRAVH